MILFHIKLEGNSLLYAVKEKLHQISKQLKENIFKTIAIGSQRVGHDLAPEQQQIAIAERDVNQLH